MTDDEKQAAIEPLREYFNDLGMTADDIAELQALLRKSDDPEETVASYIRNYKLKAMFDAE